MPKVDPAIAAAQATVCLDDHTDWTARKVASYTRVLENALTKIKKEVQLASYSNSPLSALSFKQLFHAPEPASKWEWDPKTEQDLMLRMQAGRVLAQQPRKKGYADASNRRKGFHLQPRRLSPAKEEGGCPTGSVFKNYLQNANLRRSVLITGANPTLRPHYATVLQQHASIVKQRATCSPVKVPSLAVLSARAFGRAIVMARDPEDLQGDYSWYSYCDENSNMYNLLAETLRGHITQLLCDYIKEDWFPQDLAATMIAQSVNAGDDVLTEVLFHATYHGAFDDKTRSVARRKGELAPDPFSHILHMPGVLFRQIGLAIEERPEMMLDAWFKDVMIAGLGEMGLHTELPKLTTNALELLLGIEVWEDGMRRRRLNRTGKVMRKKYQSFDKAWLFQSKEAVQSKAADVAQDLMERLFEVGWGLSDVTDETRATVRSVVHGLVEHMILWAKAFNHPHKEASEGSSITARTLALCAVLLDGKDENSLPIEEVTEELVRLLLVTMIEASEDDGDAQNGDTVVDTFDLPDLANYVAGVISKVYSSPIQRQEFVEGLLNLAIGDSKPDFTRTPAVGDKLKLQQKRQSYLVAIFAYHLATSLAESSKLEAAHVFAAGVEHRLVGLRISKKGLLKASDLKTPRFSNLIRDVAQTEVKNNRWVYEPMLNEWVEVQFGSDTGSGSDGATDTRKVSRKLNFSSQQGARSRAAKDDILDSREMESDKVMSVEPEEDTDDRYEEEDSTVYPASADTTIMETDVTPLSSPPSSTSAGPNFLVEVCIQSPLKVLSSPELSFSGSSSSGGGNRISGIFRQSKRMRGGELKKAGIIVQPLSPRKLSRTADSVDDDAMSTSESQNDSQDCIPVVARKKRGRPRKIPISTTIHARRLPSPSASENCSAYDPDSDNDDKSESLRRRKKRRGPLSQIKEGDKAYQTRITRKDMDGDESCGEGREAEEGVFGWSVCGYEWVKVEY
ncbi:hypothetical protein ABW20_dc0102260 [Dactylellina cionopaga]|nr:hypothetical protein ABW20_dc0102260 [Dactylellina cionopaga]